ncbi:unnamed protein product [Lathyrus oleraceus]
MKSVFIILLILSIHFGNQVEMIEAKECNKVVAGLCRKSGRSIQCKIQCKALCGSFSARGECGKDQDCHCRCC